VSEPQLDLLYEITYSMHMERTPLKPLLWMGSSQDAIRTLPEDVQDEIGYALYQVQCGGTPRSAKPLKGFPGASVLEIVEDFDTNTYRAVYTVRFAGVVYVLHVFQKKSRRGIATPQGELDLVKRRLAQAEAHYRKWQHAQRTEEV
jgi:phage-related protein